ncbi:MAG: hypothetical protein WD825_11175 [Gemmatimonadaceae bacterium]
MRIGILAMFMAGALLIAAPTESFAQKKQRDVITREEIEKSGQKDLDLFAVIRALRPHFLEGPRGVRTLGGGAIYPVLVVVDSKRQSPEILTQIMALDVKEVRYLEPARSQNEYGINANGGAIVVKMIGAKEKEK